jgi:uncharacterized protein (DUF697 family)
MRSILPDLSSFGRRISEALGDVWGSVVSPPRDPALDEAIRQRAELTAPVVWLIGKVQSGKSSIVQALTGASAAEVGSGFRACTRTAQIFDFPDDAPVVRFLDTRGLGEAGYDPAEDIAFAEGQAHLLLVVMKATDPGQDAVLEVVRSARRRHPGWPVLVAQTCLHEAYPPGNGHVLPYPFMDSSGHVLADATQQLPGDLARILAWQRSIFDDLPGNGAIAFVPIDFTQPGDGLEPRLYGIEALDSQLANVAPAAIAEALTSQGATLNGTRERRANPHILGYAAAAAAADVIPVAGAVAVPAIQAKMLHSLGEIYGVTWDRRMVGEFAGALGTGTILRLASTFGARELAKLVPVYGQTAGAAAAAAMSFATTYALGKAATYYLGRTRVGVTDSAGVLEAYQDALKRAFSLARERKLLPPAEAQSAGAEGSEHSDGRRDGEPKSGPRS